MIVGAWVRSALSSPTAITALVIASVGTLMLLGEWAAPLRATVEPKLRRIARNLTSGAISLGVTSWLHPLLLLPVVAWAQREKIGLLHHVPWPHWAGLLASVVLLDYTLWWWHWANHRIPFFWRFHLVHHVDRDLDTSTALRFHFGELALSIPFRALQVLVIGVDTQGLWLWQAILFASLLFHHANIRLPAGVERRLVRLIVTPRMHGIHHSDREEETNSNWSSLLSAWDFLHGTSRLDVPQESITIGVPAYDDAHDVTLGKILALPFQHQRNDWSREEKWRST
jgi:sterol desaturase/sphingolipid hydroxylase (fatty acid hydroxylase superfamily)